MKLDWKAHIELEEELIEIICECKLEYGFLLSTLVLFYNSNIPLIVWRDRRIWESLVN